MDFKLVVVNIRYQAPNGPRVPSSYIRFFRFFASPRIHLLFDGPRNPGVARGNLSAAPVDVRGPEVCLEAVYEFQCYGGDDGDLNLGGWSIKRSGSVFFVKSMCQGNSFWNISKLCKTQKCQTSSIKHLLISGTMRTFL